MLRKLTGYISLFIAGLLLSQPSLAADNGIYLGLGLTQTKIDADLENSSFRIPVDGTDTKFKVIAGVRPLDWLAFEVNYLHFGTVERGGGEFELKGYDAFAVGLFSFAVVDIYGKAGIVRWNSEERLSGNVGLASITSRDTDSGYDPVYGVGVQARLGSLGVRAEYEKFDIEAANKVEMISVGITWTFL